MTHDDGTPKSTGNHFTWNTGEPSMFMKDSYFNRLGKMQESAASNFNVHILTKAESERTQAIRNSK